MQKTCKICKNTKNINLFVNDKRLKDGHITTCKACKNEKARYLWHNDEEYKSKTKKAQRETYLKYKE